MKINHDSTFFHHGETAGNRMIIEFIVPRVIDDSAYIEIESIYDTQCEKERQLSDFPESEQEEIIRACMDSAEADGFQDYWEGRRAWRENLEEWKDQD